MEQTNLGEIANGAQASGVTLAEVAQVNALTNFKSLEQLEKEHILKALELTGGNKTQASVILGITIKTLYNKLHKYGEFEKYAVHTKAPPSAAKV